MTGTTGRQPTTSSGLGEYGGWIICAAITVVAGSSLIVATAGAGATAIAGYGWDWRWQLTLVVQLISDGGPATLWPHTNPAVFYLLTVVLVGCLSAPVVTGARLVMRRRTSSADPARHLASARDVNALREAHLRTHIGRLRPDLTHPQPDDLGPRLGRLAPSGPVLRSSWEDVHLLVMAPRAGKTTAFAVPVVIDAPGPVLATSNKADLYTDSAGIRAKRGRVWVFDPQRIALTEQAMSWNPLAAVDSIDDARRLASHFMQEVSAGARESDFWSSAALGLLASLILAARVSETDLHQVWRWLNDSADPEPAEALTAAGLTATAAGLRGRQSGAVETREGIYETARTAAQCLESPHVMAWVTDNDHPTFDPTAFVSSSDGLYLLSKEDAGSAQPLVAALADQVIKAAVTTAETHGGRISPPLTCVLDEAANVCKIRDLPKLYSHLGSRGISTWTILQSYRQGQGVWSELGMDTLWSAATIKIIGSGLDDPRLTEDLSRLAGQHDIRSISRSSGRGGPSTTTSDRRERIIRADQIRALPRGRALLLATATPVAMLTTQPWYQRADADQIQAAATQQRAALANRGAQR